MILSPGFVFLYRWFPDTSPETMLVLELPDPYDQHARCLDLEDGEIYYLTSFDLDHDAESL